MERQTPPLEINSEIISQANPELDFVEETTPTEQPEETLLQPEIETKLSDTTSQESPEETAENCKHHFLLPMPNGPEALGACKKCGITKAFKNSMDSYDEENRRWRMPKLSHDYNGY